MERRFPGFRNNRDSACPCWWIDREPSGSAGRNTITVWKTGRGYGATMGKPSETSPRKRAWENLGFGVWSKTGMATSGWAPETRACTATMEDRLPAFQDRLCKFLRPFGVSLFFHGLTIEADRNDQKFLCDNLIRSTFKVNGPASPGGMERDSSSVQGSEGVSRSRSQQPLADDDGPQPRPGVKPGRVRRLPTMVR